MNSLMAEAYLRNNIHNINVYDLEYNRRPYSKQKIDGRFQTGYIEIVLSYLVNDLRHFILLLIKNQRRIMFGNNNHDMNGK